MAKQGPVSTSRGRTEKKVHGTGIDNTDVQRHTRAPKDQVERYSNPGYKTDKWTKVTKFKTDEPMGAIPYHWKVNPTHDVHEPFWDVSRGKRGEVD